MKKAGLPHLRLHDLRHSYATFLLKAGQHPSVVASQPGHSSVRTTLDVYSHVVPGLREAAARSLETFLPRQLSEGSH
jgi:integrase